MKYDIHFYKVEKLSPDELNQKRRKASGIWVLGGVVEARSSRSACAIYRASGELGYDAKKIRAID